MAKYLSPLQRELVVDVIAAWQRTRAIDALADHARDLMNKTVAMAVQHGVPQTLLGELLGYTRAWANQIAMNTELEDWATREGLVDAGTRLDTQLLELYLAGLDTDYYIGPGRDRRATVDAALAQRTAQNSRTTSTGRLRPPQAPEKL